MAKLDESIDTVLDALMVYAKIMKTGNCNTCGRKNTCQYCPELGQLVRYNCPHYQKEDEE